MTHTAGAVPDLSGGGAARVSWAERQMPVLAAVRDRFATTQPLDGWRIAACLHVTSETAVLVRTLVAGGAEVHLAASNPLSTQDDVAAALAADKRVRVHARAGVDHATYYRQIEAVLDAQPRMVLDDGCDLVGTLHARGAPTEIVGGCEDTTTGVVRLRALHQAGGLRFPMVAVNDTPTSRLFDNRHGTGQSTVDALMRATNMLLAGRTVVVAGYGPCGRGVAGRMRGLGAHVLVTEVAPARALEAVLDGYDVVPLAEAAPRADVVVTATGNTGVVRGEHLELLADGTVLANAGHFDVEIDVGWLRAHAVDVHRGVRPQVDAYLLADGRRLLLVADGRIANLGAAEGNPPAVMDVSFATQALVTAWLAETYGSLRPGVLAVPAAIDAEVARLTLAALDVRLDELTDGQRAYLQSWEHGS